MLLLSLLWRRAGDGLLLLSLLALVVSRRQLASALVASRRRLASALVASRRQLASALVASRRRLASALLALAVSTRWLASALP